MSVELFTKSLYKSDVLPGFDFQFEFISKNQ